MCIPHEILCKSNKNKHILFRKCSRKLCVFLMRFYTNQKKTNVYFYKNILVGYVYSSCYLIQNNQKRTFTFAKMFELAIRIPHELLSKSNKNERLLFQKCSCQLCQFLIRFYPSQTKTNISFFKNILASYVYSSSDFLQSKQKQTFTFSKMFQLPVCIPHEILSKLNKSERLLFQKSLSQLCLFLMRFYPNQRKTNIYFFKIVLASSVYSSQILS